MIWKRIAEGVYQSGPWTARKEFYADGPSLFVWKLTGPNEIMENDRWEEFGTLARAKAYADRATAHYNAALGLYSATQAGAERA